MTSNFYTPTDIDALRMENELLAFEVRFLKARVAQPDRRAEKLERDLAEAKNAAKKTEEHLKAQVARLQAQNANLQAQEANRQAHSANLQAQNASLQAQNANLQARVASLQAQLAQVQASGSLGRLFRRGE